MGGRGSSWDSDKRPKGEKERKNSHLLELVIESQVLEN